MLKKLLLIAVTVSAMYEFAECGCWWQNKTYDVGETWSLADFACVNCTCKINDNGLPAVSCKNTPCPKLKCRNPTRDPNMCCPYCEDIPNIPPTVADAEEYRKVEQRAGCDTPGGHYKDGEVYSSNSTGIRPTSENQCVLCVCQNGRSLCHLKTCLIPKTCSKFINTSDDCCPQCADVSEITWDDPEFYENKAIIDSHLEEDDCLDTSGIKRNGTSWHPTVANIGQIDCITCSCINGEIKCKKNCVPDHELPCKHPQKHSGDCCKQCPESDTKEDKKRRKNRKKKRKDRKKKGKGKGKKRPRRKIDCNDEKNKNKKRCRKRKKERVSRTPPSSIATTTAPGVELKNLCIRKNTKYLVYKAIQDKDMFIAFDDLEGETVEVFRWLISEGDDGSVVTYTEPEILPASDFRRQINNTNVVGTTGQKHYKRFKRRLKAKLGKCTDSCKPELFIKILQRVKVRLLKFGEECKT